MKIFLLLFIPFIIFASGEMMTTTDYLYFSGVDKQPFKEQNVDARLYSIAKIDEKKARSIAQDLTKETVLSLKFTHSGRYIIYTIVTQSRKVTINALDGTVIQKSVK